MDDFNSNTTGSGNDDQATNSSGGNIISRIGRSSIKAANEIKEAVISTLPSTHPKVAKNKKQKAKKGQLSKQYIEDSKKVLITANTVFPFTPFPDTVIVDRTKVTIVQRTFFMTAKTISLRIEDILNVSTSVGPVFGSIRIATRVMSTVDHFEINYFWRRDAIQLKHVIQGYIIALHGERDIEHLSNEELIPMLSDLGHDSSA